MNTQTVHEPRDDWVEQALAGDGRAFRDAYLPDEGFTARVLTALPPPVQMPAWRRPAVAALWLVAGAAAAIAMPDAFHSLADALLRVLGNRPVGITQIAAGIVTVGALGIFTAVWVMRDE